MTSTRTGTADGSRRSPTGGPDEIWSFGPEAEGILVDHLHLRERLRPYLRHVTEQAHLDGQPVMRALFHEFPKDPEAWGESESFLLGSALLVAPVLEAGARWGETATGVEHDGGSHVTAAAPLGTIPSFVRIGHPDALLLGGLVGNHL